MRGFRLPIVFECFVFHFVLYVARENSGLVMLACRIALVLSKGPGAHTKGSTRESKEACIGQPVEDQSGLSCGLVGLASLRDTSQIMNKHMEEHRAWKVQIVLGRGPWRVPNAGLEPVSSIA